MAKPPFSNSMEPDNQPSNEDSVNNGANDDRTGYGPEQRVGQNAGVDTSVEPGYPLPPDPHSPAGKDYDEKDSAELTDFGLNENVEVGHSSSINQYGIDK